MHSFRVSPLTSDEAVRNLANPLQPFIDKIFKEGPTDLDVAGRFAKRSCSNCRGNGYVAFLQRAGATDKEPRTARLCGCARKAIQRRARQMQAAEAAERRSGGD